MKKGTFESMTKYCNVLGNTDDEIKVQSEEDFKTLLTLAPPLGQRTREPIYMELLEFWDEI
jgi:hypothetical protein